MTSKIDDISAETVEVPVICQNGHKAIAVYTWRADAMEFVFERPKAPHCLCPKFGLGQGWKPNGKPRVASGEVVLRKDVEELVKHATHRSNCDWTRSFPRMQCNCGYDEALARFQPKEAE